MQINRVDNRPNFKAVNITPAAKKIMLERMPEEELNNFINTYKKSSVFVHVFNSARRLMANVRYSNFRTSVKENALASFLRRSPQGFFRKIGNEVNSLEETFQLTRKK